MTHLKSACALAIFLFAPACMRDIDETPDSTAASAGATTGVATTQPAAPAVEAPLRVEVDVTTRMLSVYRDGAVTTTYPVAVGTAEWPTKTGSWTISQVVWNPEWVPPTDESWAKDEKPSQPGASDNPLGQVQLIYDPPRTIHGTNEPASIGKAASHGSIRMRNADAVALAQAIMEAGGAQKDSAWVAGVRRKRTVKEVVDLPTPIPIVVK
jgi:lipoprotein-anchoring transpeptidase ErfK/SrfK